MSHTQGRHTKATPRRRAAAPGAPRRRGLVIGALAVLVAAIVAIPALVAFAAQSPVSVKITPQAKPETDIIRGEDVWSDDATYTVSVTVDGDVVFDETSTKVEGSAGAVAWANGSSWSAPVATGDGSDVIYTRDVTVSESAHNQITVTPYYTEPTDTPDEPSEPVAGEAETYNKRVTVDKSAPVVSIKMSQATTGNSGAVEGKVDFFGENDLSATIIVTDPTFDSGKTTVSDARGRKMRVGSWSQNGDTWTASVDVESTNSFTVSAKDKISGHDATETAYGTNTTDANGTELTGRSYEIDRDKPKVSMTFGGDPSKTHFKDEGGVEVVVTVSDKHLGDTVISCNGTDETNDWTHTSNGNGTEAFTKTFSGEGAYEISVNTYKSYDIAHVLDWLAGSSTQTLTIDGTAPTMAVEFVNDPTPVEVNGEKYYAAQRTAQVTVTDALSFGADKMVVKVNDNEAKNLEWTDGENGAHVATLTFGTDDGTYPDGAYELTVSGEDLAGNQAVMADDATKTEYASERFVVDTTDPELTISCDNDDVQNEKYYQAARTFTIVASDTNLNPDTFETTVDGESVDQMWAVQDDGSHTTSVTFDTEGTHTLSVKVQDYAGNTYTVEVPEFVIDLTDPEIDLSWQNAGSQGENTYYNGGRVATVHVDEENFDSELIDIKTTGTVGTWDEESQSVTVTFDKDGAYRLQVTGSDLSGRSAEPKDSGDFFIDTTAPVLSVDFADGDEAVDQDGDTAYYDNDRTATITVVEKNFDPERVEITGAGTQGAWQDGRGDTHTLEVTFPESADPYQMTVHAVDRAGNGSVDGEGNAFTYDSGTFVVDKTAPTVSIALDQPLVQPFDGSDYFAAAPTATITVKDVNFKGIASPVTPAGGEAAAWTKGETDENGVSTWTITVAFTEGTGRSLDVSALDWAGHETAGAYGTDTTDADGTQLTSPVFVVDQTAPEVTSASVDHDPSNSYGDNYYFNAATTLTVNVEDNIGIESLTMTDADDGTYVLDNQIDAGATSGTVTIGFQDGHDFDRAVTVRTTDLAHNYRYWSIAPDGTVQAVNYADPSNEPVFDGTYPETMLQDTVAPVVSLSGVEAGAYYNSPQSVRLSVQELNIPILKTYEPDQVVLTVTQVAGNASRATRTWTRPLSQLASTGEGIGYALSEPFSADGHYTVSAQVTDPARNQDTAELGEFTIDMTAPEVSVSFDNNDVRNGKYYNAGRTATIVVTEHNFDPQLVSIETNGSVGAWSTNGDTHTVSVSFSADGVYNLSVSGSDRAGNAMTPYQADEFVVDTKAPEITFGGVEDATAYNGDVAPSVTFLDEANFDPNGVSYTLTGSKNGTVSYEAGVSSEGQSQTVSYANFVRDPEVDDIYTINAEMTDLAGNAAEGSITFSVNRFGSTFRVIDAGSYKENDGYLTERRDVLVEEINVSGVGSEDHGVTVTEGTNVDELALNETAQDTGYTIEEGTSSAEDSNGWASYTYRIAAGNFDRDGRYHVSVESQDRADNTNTSSNYFDREAGKTAAAEVDFILDTTDPVITNLNVTSGTTYDAATYEGSFTVVENIGVRDVEVLVDGEAVTATDDGFGNYTFPIEAASFTSRTLNVTATDLAGRSATAEAGNFHVTTDIFELHLPWVIAGVVVVLGVAGGAYYLLVVKKKRDEDENEAAA